MFAVNALDAEDAERAMGNGRQAMGGENRHIRTSGGNLTWRPRADAGGERERGMDGIHQGIPAGLKTHDQQPPRPSEGVVVNGLAKQGNCPRHGQQGQVC